MDTQNSDAETKDNDSYIDEATLRDLYADEMSQEQIAYELDCSVSTVDKWMRYHGIHVGKHSVNYSRHGEQVGETRTTAHDREDQYPGDETILALHEDGLSLAEIAEETGQPKHVIYIQLDYLTK